MTLGKLSVKMFMLFPKFTEKMAPKQVMNPIMLSTMLILIEQLCQSATEILKFVKAPMNAM